ncbi:MAG TPA: class I SAM-dependent methyltransferase [Candidatus Limnocylindrales bacterium]|nr:class I SAM-dependent methyltransferase [Candidatus Limnocylindrales bacterium]
MTIRFERELSEHRRDWEELARLDPYWAILTHPERRHGRWAVDEFFLTGEAEARRVLDRAASLGLPRTFGRLLDVGCGLGRVTRGFAPHFVECHGCDISAAMIDGARTLNRDLVNCRFTLVSGRDLGAFESASFDMVYCRFVLQHLPGGQAIRDSIVELVRVLAVDGLLVFQLPSELSLVRRLQPRRRLYGLLRRLGVDPGFAYRRLGLQPIRTSFLPVREVREIVARAGADLLRVEPDSVGGRGIASRVYLATKATRIIQAAGSG